jgi:hypothetical protein
MAHQLVLRRICQSLESCFEEPHSVPEDPVSAECNWQERITRTDASPGSADSVQIALRSPLGQLPNPKTLTVFRLASLNKT